MINKTRDFFISIASSKPAIKNVDSILSTFKTVVNELEEAARQQDQVVSDKNAEIQNLQSEVNAAKVESDRAKSAAKNISSFFN